MAYGIVTIGQCCFQLMGGPIRPHVLPDGFPLALNGFQQQDDFGIGHHDDPHDDPDSDGCEGDSDVCEGPLGIMCPSLQSDTIAGGLPTGSRKKHRNIIPNRSRARGTSDGESQGYSHWRFADRRTQPNINDQRELESRDECGDRKRPAPTVNMQGCQNTQDDDCPRNLRG